MSTQKLQELIDKLASADAYGKGATLSADDIKTLWLYVLPADWRRTHPMRTVSSIVRREALLEDDEPTSPDIKIARLRLAKR